MTIDIEKAAIVDSFFALGDSHGGEVKEIGNGFRAQEVRDFDKNAPAASDDTYHCYSHVGFNASNTVHHHPYGDVTVFHGITSPFNEHSRDGNMIVNSATKERYVIIADQWTGKRIKVFLPYIDPATAEVFTPSK